MNGNGKVAYLSRESEVDRAIRTMPTKDALRQVVRTLDAQGDAMHHLREVSGENTTRLNEHDGYVSILNEKITALTAEVEALKALLKPVA